MNKFFLVVLSLLISWFLFPNVYNGQVLAQVSPDDSEYYYSESESAPSSESGCEETCNEDSNCDSGTCGSTCDPTLVPDCATLDSSCTTAECLCQAAACDSTPPEESSAPLASPETGNEDSNTDSGTCTVDNEDDNEDDNLPDNEDGSEEVCAPVCQLDSTAFAAKPALDRTEGYYWWLPSNSTISSSFGQISIVPIAGQPSPANSFEVCFSMPINCPLGPSPSELLALRRTWNQTMDNLKAACDGRVYCDKDGGTGTCSSGYNMTWPPGVAFPPAVVPNPGGGMRMYGCASFSCNPDPDHLACD